MEIISSRSVYIIARYAGLPAALSLIPGKFRQLDLHVGGIFMLHNYGVPADPVWRYLEYVEQARLGTSKSIYKSNRTD